MSDNHLLLAIETSQREGSIAIGTGDGTVHVERLSPARRHDDDLIPAIEHLFVRLGLRPRDLEAVAVSCGPGGFTGLRIAATTAKMFAQTLGAAIVAVPSALVAAQAHDGDGPIVVALASKAGSFWSTRLQRSSGTGGGAGAGAGGAAGGAWEIVGQASLCVSDELALEGARAVLADEFFPAAARDACQRAGTPVIESRMEAASCLAAGRRMLMLGCTIGALDEVLLYARRPEAVSLWEKRSGR